MTSSPGRPYPWLEPSSVKGEGKYRVTADGQVKVLHISGRNEMSLLASDPHAELVAMVGGVKRAHGEQPSGIFYINEWGHVLVKAAGATWYAGQYRTILEFDLGGGVLSARAPQGLPPGERWPGPQVGIRYTIAATGDDVYCKRRIDVRTERQERLSDYIADSPSFVRELARHRPTGGRLYINEAREMFSPLDGEGSFVYLGRAPIDRWFPEPQP
ncbi:hypothetical protein [Cellulomonas sp. Leaf334]|uniref:hypothetical protein n=1 Tax=Cellulomonas sp. Leaf334 TaxID=1736339 RepID=UPI000AE0E51B|nr:hypothetical protein [Cellulomonas sp. Leaf334]